MIFKLRYDAFYKTLFSKYKVNTILWKWMNAMNISTTESFMPVF